EKLLLVFLVPGSFAVAFAVGGFAQALVGAGVATADRLALAALQEASDLVARQAEEPAAKRALRRVVLPAAHALRDRLRDALRQVGRVGVLETAAAHEPVHHTAVQFDEQFPRRLVLGVAQAEQQAGAGQKCVGHGRPYGVKKTARHLPRAPAGRCLFYAGRAAPDMPGRRVHGNSVGRSSASANNDGTRRGVGGGTNARARAACSPCSAGFSQSQAPGLDQATGGGSVAGPVAKRVLKCADSRV